MRKSGPLVTALLCAVVLCFLVSGPVRGQQPSIPPDIQALMNKQKSGQKLTPDEMAKLINYAQTVAGQMAPISSLPGATMPLPKPKPGQVVAGPQVPSAGAPIPVQAKYTIQYTQHSTNGGTVDSEVTWNETMSVDLPLVASITVPYVFCASGGVDMGNAGATDTPSDYPVYHAAP